MPASLLLQKVGRALRKDPRYLARRVCLEVQAESERWLGPRRAARTDLMRLARTSGLEGIDALWSSLHSRLYAHPMPSAADLEALSKSASAELLQRAEWAHELRVDLLGSGPTTLASPIDWHADLKTGHRWPPMFHRDIDYNNFDRPSDVKMAWELSRLQWALPLGQAWRLTGDDRHAAKVRTLLEQWIDSNPYGASVNWACTMEPALRVLTWTWLFHACADAPSWVDPSFRERFLSSLYLHGDFVSRNLERADVNGNHYTADAAGLVYAGIFFGSLGDAPKWAQAGWDILTDELPRQVFPDGVDYEASVPYHRLVLELFAYPALFRRKAGLTVPTEYRKRLVAMGRFAAAYGRGDGSVPFWGDADDARALAFGTQSLNDHRYLVGIVGLAFDAPELINAFAGPRDEVAWILGPQAAQRLPCRDAAPGARSAAFREGGFYVLRDDRNHVFVDCGPIGLAGRGGHGHNDLLAFEAVLDGMHLISDCGAYLYTASPSERNHFRSTGCHNTPQVDGEEINRFVGPQYLWVLHNDAAHELLEWKADERMTAFEGAHTGYSRLNSPVRVRRRIELHHADCRLTISDQFEGQGEHEVVVPFHLAIGVEATLVGADRVLLRSPTQTFTLMWRSNAPWAVEVQNARVSPAYGRVVSTQVLRLRRRGSLFGLTVTLEPLR